MRLETFFEKFELFAAAPNAVAKMRELVRELAGPNTEATLAIMCDRRREKCKGRRPASTQLGKTPRSFVFPREAAV